MNISKIFLILLCVVLLLAGATLFFTKESIAPITLSTADTQTFTHPSDLFSVQIPTKYNLDYNKEHDILFVYKEIDTLVAAEAPYLSISVASNPDGLSLNEYYDGSPGIDYVSQINESSFREVLVDGISSWRVVPYISLSSDVIVIVPLENQFLEIFDFGSTFQANGVFDSIVKSVVTHE